MTFIITMERFRAFDGSQSVSLRPITLLVGPNSAGKSSVLAALRYLADFAKFGSAAPAFNRPPFNLGAYDQIAFNKAADFKLGFQGLLKPSTIRLGTAPEEPQAGEFEVAFRKYRGQPALYRVLAKGGNQSIALEFDEKWQSASLQVTIGGRRTSRTSEIPSAWSTEAITQRPFVLQFLADQILRGSEDGRMSVSSEALELSRATDLLGTALESVPATTFVGAPVRSQPRRTYDPIEMAQEPEGAHVPSQLAQIARTNPAEWESISKGLIKFGRESGLFSDLRIRSLGRTESDPFQITIAIKGPRRNLIDVGYGVSQSIPIVFELLKRREGAVYMAQQPEVHLHPEAQAALGSFVVRESARLEGYIVLETHSDFLIDRVRRHVREGLVSPENISLLYLYRSQGSSTIGQLELDKKGDVIDPPKHYREFFLREQFSNLGFPNVSDS